MNQLTLELPAGVSPDDARLMLAFKLYEIGRLSLGQAAQLSGLPKPAFMDRLGQAGIAIFNQSASDLENEAG